MHQNLPFLGAVTVDLITENDFQTKNVQLILVDRRFTPGYLLFKPN